MDCSLPGSFVQEIFQARILEWVVIFFSRGIFLTHGSNLGLLHCRQILCRLSHQGRPSSLLRGQRVRRKCHLLRPYWTCPTCDQQTHHQSQPAYRMAVRFHCWKVPPLSNLFGCESLTKHWSNAWNGAVLASTAWQHRALGTVPWALHAGWLGNKFKGMWLPEGLQGPPVHTQQCRSPGAAEWGSLVEMRQLTGRAILFGVCIQSCQFRSPFHLLNHELCRTKYQAGFKAGGCAEPRLWSHCQPHPASSLGPLTTDTGLFSTQTLWFLWRFLTGLLLPTDHSRGKWFKDAAPHLWNRSYPAWRGYRGLFVGGMDFVKGKPSKVGRLGKNSWSYQQRETEAQKREVWTARWLPKRGHIASQIARTLQMISLLPRSNNLFSFQQISEWNSVCASNLISFHCFLACIGTLYSLIIRNNFKSRPCELHTL